MTKNPVKQLYHYQEKDIQLIFEKLELPRPVRFLYQLPTGGGKTVVFSEIAKRYIEHYGRTVTILTHRKELCQQTSTTLKHLGIANKIISSRSKNFNTKHNCYVAMVETLRNRIKSKKIRTQDVGLVIIDEAHHNSFRKLLRHFKHASVIGVTATPFSSDTTKPMKRQYESIIAGESIASLITGGFLATPKSIEYEVELNMLKTGVHGDYTVGSSNELYGSKVMLDLLLQAYLEHSAGKKALIFNNGIAASVKVCNAFEAAGVSIRHLDNRTPSEERKELLNWFKKTKGAVLTSVSILTTGFDEPSVQTVILNRATTSITLYHQMVGRGSRRLPSKKSFQIIDLGNNIQRFGPWEAPVDWHHVFEHPEAFAQQLQGQSAGSSVQSHGLSAALRAQFPNTLELTFDVEGHYQEALETEQKPKVVVQQSIRQQALMCLENATTLSEALHLAEALLPEIEWRIKQYVGCLERASKSYKEWLLEDYQLRLSTLIKKLYARRPALETVNN